MLSMVARRWRLLPALVMTALVLTSVSCGTGRAASTSAAGTDMTLAIAGDVHFWGRTAKLLDDPATALGPMAPILTAADLAVVNLETPITVRGQAEPKRYLFRTDPRAVTALQAGGVDAISLANNHTLDYGRDGLADTIAAARQQQLGVFGAGRNADEAFAPWRTTVRGTRVAVFGFSQVHDLAESWAARDDRAGIAMAFDVDRAVAAVSAARGDSDLVIVMAHWGAEYDRCPTRLQQTFAARLAHAGADIIVGAHGHVLQGAGWLGDTYVAYGLGNYLWYINGLSVFSPRTGVLKLTVHGRRVVKHEFVPAELSAAGQATELTGWKAQLAQRNYAELRTCAGLAP